MHPKILNDELLAQEVVLLSIKSMSWETGANLFVVTSFCLHPATRRVFFFASLDLLFLKMASESEFSLSSTSSKSDEESEDSEQDMEVVYSRFEPYQDEPLADSDCESDDGEEADQDGLTPTILEARFEKQVAVNEW